MHVVLGESKQHASSSNLESPHETDRYPEAALLGNPWQLGQLNLDLEHAAACTCLANYIVGRDLDQLPLLENPKYTLF